MNNSPKLVIFDCDGTLVDSQHMICAAMQQAFLDHRIAARRARRCSRLSACRSRRRSSASARARRAFRSRRWSSATRPPSSRCARRRPTWNRYFRACAKRSRTLSARDDMLLGIATGKSQRGVRMVLGHHGLLDAFRTIKTADDAPSKPHPGMVMEAMREAGALPGDTVVIGDTSYDIEMARAAGACAIGVAWGYHPVADLHAAGAYEVIDDASLLPSALERVFGRRLCPRRNDMRDIFDDIYKNNPLDPEEAVRRNMRVDLRKRFYEKAAIDQERGRVSILLDGKPVKTPARRVLAAPTRALAEAIAEEWDAQKDVIDPARMPLTRLANSVIDGVVDAPRPVADEIERYLGSDLLFYRADGPEGLTRRRRALGPGGRLGARTLGARFILAEGVVFAPQPEEAIAAARRAIPKDPWSLGAVHSVTTLTGSALARAGARRRAARTDAAWTAAHVDEDWNLATWGRDEAALARRTLRFAEMQAAARCLSFVSSWPSG